MKYIVITTYEISPGVVRETEDEHYESTNEYMTEKEWLDFLDDADSFYLEELIACDYSSISLLEK